MDKYDDIAGQLSNLAQEAFHSCEAVHDEVTFHTADFVVAATAILREAFPDEGRKNHPVLNPKVLVADIRAEGSPGKGRWKMSRKMAGDAVIAFTKNWAANVLVAQTSEPSDSAKGDTEARMAISRIKSTLDHGGLIDRFDLLCLIQEYERASARAEKAEAEARTLAQEIIDYRTWTVPGPRKENARKVFEHALAALDAGKEE